MDWGVSHRVAVLPRFRKPWERPAFLRECRILAELLAGHKPDGILSNEWVTAPHALEVARHLGVPALSYVRDFAAVKRGRKYLLHRMDRLLCVCESMRQALIDTGYDPAKVHTVCNPVLQPVASEPEDEVHARLLGMPPMDRWLCRNARRDSRSGSGHGTRFATMWRTSRRRCASADRPTRLILEEKRTRLLQHSKHSFHLAEARARIFPGSFSERMSLR